MKRMFYELLSVLSFALRRLVLKLKEKGDSKDERDEKHE